MKNRKHNQEGLTLIDLLVVMSGILPAFLVCHYFEISPQSPVCYLLTLVFGISFWCTIFLWWLPARDRRQGSQGGDEANQDTEET